jgi:tRNA G10  N-methylase Trm11
MIDPRKAGPLSPALFEYETSFENLTHYLFRYPAKFHPPIARSLIERLTEPGQTICDPFMGSGSLAIEAMVAAICDPFMGSGSLAIEAMVAGRNSIGVDVDPLAVAVARAKSRRYQIPSLRKHAEQLCEKLEKRERPASEYKRRMFVDLSKVSLRNQLRGLNV